jgi:hypothetical protein
MNLVTFKMTMNFDQLLLIDQVVSQIQNKKLIPEICLSPIYKKKHNSLLSLKIALMEMTPEPVKIVKI